MSDPTMQRQVEVSRRIAEAMLRGKASGIYDLELYSDGEGPQYLAAKQAAEAFDAAAVAYIQSGTGLEAMQKAWNDFLQASKLQ